MEQTHFRLTLRTAEGEKVPGPIVTMLGDWMEAEIISVERWYHVTGNPVSIDLDGKGGPGGKA